MTEEIIKKVENEFQELKNAFDKACNERKEYLNNKCECCEISSIEVEHPIKEQPVLFEFIDGVDIMKLNMAFLCNNCFEQLKEQNKL